MLNATERKILEFLSNRLLTTKGEIIEYCVKQSIKNDGIDVSLERLRDLGLVQKVESLGICYVITQKGIKEFNEMR